jgi:predicted transcriptional regulator
MAKNKQKNLRLDSDEDEALQRIARVEGRTEQDILRDSLHMYVRAADERMAFLSSVEQGWVEIHSGLGEIVGEDDNFFDLLKKEIREKNAPA